MIIVAPARLPAPAAAGSGGRPCDVTFRIPRVAQACYSSPVFHPPASFLLSLLILVLASLPASAQVTNGVIGIYHKGMNFEEPVLKRYDATINFNWGEEAPAIGVPEDQFSVRWTGQVVPQFSEEYTFYTESDDGVRLWVNGKAIVTNWTDHGPTEDKGVIKLVAGERYDLVMEFYENGGGAMAKLSWSSRSTPKAIVPKERLFPKEIAPPDELDPAKIPADARGLIGKYFRNTQLTGKGVLRLDKTVDFNWGQGPPGVRGIAEDNFSVRWTARLQVDKSETYTFHTESDDGVRLWVNGQQLVDNWTDHATAEDKGAIQLEAGRQYDVVMEYYEATGDAVARLFWSSPSFEKVIIPQSRLFPRVLEGKGEKK